MNKSKKIIIGTRGSKLALWQTNFVRNELSKLFSDIEFEIKEIKTKGDEILDIALSKIGDKGLFTKEIEEALLKNEIDLAVHSLKDLPSKLPDGLKLGAVLNRENPCDVLLIRENLIPENNKITFKSLPANSNIGTTSLRRISQLKSIRKDLNYVDIRGNIDTRIKKLNDGLYDAIVLAYAGIKRLGFESSISEYFNPKEIIPAVGQGALGVEIRENDNLIQEIISKISNYKNYLACISERAFLHTLEGGCQTPIGSYCESTNGNFILYGMVASLNGETIIKDKFEIKNLNEESCKYAGEKLANILKEKGANKILSEIRSRV